MELIFSEWLGVYGIEKINDKKAIVGNEKFWINKWEKELKNVSIDYIDSFKDIFNYKPKDYNILSRKETAIKALSRKRKLKKADQEKFQRLTNEIKQSVHIEIKAYVSNSFFNINLEKFDFEILNKINATHQENLKKQGVHNPNPICKIFKYNGEYCIETFQYAAEFEIPLKGNKKEKYKKKEGTLKIKILPRDLVSEKGFERMVQSIFNISSLGNISGVRSASSFLILYYMAFLKRLNDVLKRGIYREYVEMEENLHFLKERLLIPDHVRMNHFNKHKLYCSFTEFSPGNVINQTIVSTLNLISKSKFSGNNYLTSAVKNIRNTFGDVEIDRDFKLSVNSIDKIRYNRQNKRYKEIMAYCRNIIQNLGGAFGNDSIKYTAFYLDMNELFEQYVGELLKNKNMKLLGWNEDFISDNEEQNLKEWNVVLQDDKRFLDEEANMFKIKPDILIMNDNKCLAVADTKYKRLNIIEGKNYGVLSSDIYQVMAYAEKFKTNKMYLIYPKPPEGWKGDLTFKINDKKLIIKTVDLQQKDSSQNSSNDKPF